MVIYLNIFIQYGIKKFLTGMFKWIKYINIGRYLIQFLMTPSTPGYPTTQYSIGSRHLKKPPSPEYEEKKNWKKYDIFKELYSYFYTIERI